MRIRITLGTDISRLDRARCRLDSELVGTPYVEEVLVIIRLELLTVSSKSLLYNNRIMIMQLPYKKHVLGLIPSCYSKL